MKSIIVIIAMLFCCSASSQAQSDTIRIKNAVLGTTYLMNNKLLTMPKLEKILKKDAEAEYQYKRGRVANIAALVFAGAGGATIGTEIGNAVTNGRSVNPLVIVAAAGLVGISVPFSRSAQRRIKGAVATYNGHRRKTVVTDFRSDVYFTFSGNSAGIRFDF